MVEDESESRETLQNKGVNVTSDSLPTGAKKKTVNLRTAQTKTF